MPGLRLVTTVGLAMAVACSSPDRKSSRGERSPTAKRYLKGQLHAHTSNSGDSQTPPAEAADWYARHGFDFVVFTDHNVVTRLPSSAILAIPGVELTQNLRDCTPPPPRGQACLLHVNALFLADQAAAGPVPLAIQPGLRAEIYQRAFDLTASLGGIAQLNHPNMGWAVDPDLVVDLGRRRVTLMEIANQNERESNAGDRDHPSTEALWDILLSAGLMVYGVATDDAHHYDDADHVRARGEPAFVGDLGYVMVRASRDVASIRAAIVRGDFYSTTGVRLARASAGQGSLEVELDKPADDGPYEIAFIGQGGRILRTVTGTSASFDLSAAPAGYVRATVTDREGRRAWVQPVRTP